MFQASPVEPALEVLDENPAVAPGALARDAPAAVAPAPRGHGDDHGEGRPTNKSTDWTMTK
jgi:hypothetical protein